MNDNPHVDTANGGSHWSLLVGRREAGRWRWRHYDSGGPSNALVARRVHAALAPLVRGGSEAGPGSGAGTSTSDGASPAHLTQEPTPQQTNAHDCGVYCLAIADVLTQRFVRGGAAMSFKVTNEDITPASAKEFRKQVLAVIHEKMQQAQ